MLNNMQIYNEVTDSIVIVRRDVAKEKPLYLHVSVLYCFNELNSLLVDPGHVKGIVYHADVHPGTLIVSPHTDLLFSDKDNHYSVLSFSPKNNEKTVFDPADIDKALNFIGKDIMKNINPIERDIDLPELVERIFRYLDEEKHSPDMREYMSVKLYINTKWKASKIQEYIDQNLPLALACIIKTIEYTDKIAVDDFLITINKLYKRGQ